MDLLKCKVKREKGKIESQIKIWFKLLLLRFIFPFALYPFHFYWIVYLLDYLVQTSRLSTLKLRIEFLDIKAEYLGLDLSLALPQRCVSKKPDSVGE